MANPTTKTELLKAQAHELVKSHTTYDVSSRPSAIYVAQADAANGASCIVTTYTYDSTSSRVVGRKEAYSTWDSSWDI
jgi:dTDP-4-amino-4,6-dideoxygalactose transaminase